MTGGKRDWAGLVTAYRQSALKARDVSVRGQGPAGRAWSPAKRGSAGNRHDARQSYMGAVEKIETGRIRPDPQTGADAFQLQAVCWARTSFALQQARVA